MIIDVHFKLCWWIKNSMMSLLDRCFYMYSVIVNFLHCHLMHPQLIHHCQCCRCPHSSSPSSYSSYLLWCHLPILQTAYLKFLMGHLLLCKTYILVITWRAVTNNDIVIKPEAECSRFGLKCNQPCKFGQFQFSVHLHFCNLLDSCTFRAWLALRAPTVVPRAGAPLLEPSN